MRRWPLPGLPPGILTELATPSQFSEAAQSVTPEALKGRVVLGPDPAEHIQAIERYAQAGFDHVHIHQIGPDEQSAVRLYEREILPQVGPWAGPGPRRRYVWRCFRRRSATMRIQLYPLLRASRQVVVDGR
jgi:hypothetical protein